MQEMTQVSVPVGQYGALEDWAVEAPQREGAVDASPHRYSYCGIAGLLGCAMFLCAAGTASIVGGLKLLSVEAGSPCLQAGYSTLCFLTGLLFLGCGIANVPEACCPSFFNRCANRCTPTYIKVGGALCVVAGVGAIVAMLACSPPVHGAAPP